MIRIHFQHKRKAQADSEVLATDTESLTMVETAG